jgi:hypothetical protein
MISFRKLLFGYLKAREITQIDSPKAFLFATARNIALGNVRKKPYVEKKIGGFIGARHLG